MSRTDHEIRLTPSILDRLLDFEPGMSKEPPRSQAQSLADLKKSVKRDLEWLLNTRHTPIEIPETLEELNESMAVYGLPDLTALSVKNPNEQNRLAKSIETALRVFEPRFINVKVSLEPINSTDRQLRFHIEAHLDIEPVPEPVSFDTVLQVGSGEFAVSEK
ncbi:MAG TPA: type VI secretion system baseplate subunit TssE [Pyrinomonadaceae bacterium]|jgi:type VI secretion system protein ImpF|nr:type VI secretion system baseplate subunit TssE [Pyrinomonadaceae bacterium]